MKSQHDVSCAFQNGASSTHHCGEPHALLIDGSWIQYFHVVDFSQLYVHLTFASDEHYLVVQPHASSQESHGAHPHDLDLIHADH
jgi:hypothetical protein